MNINPVKKRTVDAYRRCNGMYKYSEHFRGGLQLLFDNSTGALGSLMRGSGRALVPRVGVASLARLLVRYARRGGRDRGAAPQASILLLQLMDPMRLRQQGTWGQTNRSR